MAATVTYTDSKGRKHRVDSIQAVPRRYVRSMIVEVDEEPAASSEETSADGGSGAGARYPGGKNLETVSPALIAATVFAILYWRFKNFVVRVFLVTFFAMLGIWFVISWTEEKEQEARSDAAPSWFRKQYEEFTKPKKWAEVIEGNKKDDKKKAPRRQ